MFTFYCKKDLEGAHAADADTYATYEVLQAQLDKYPDIQNNVEFLSEYTHHTNNVDFAGRIIYNEKKQEVSVKYYDTEGNWFPTCSLEIQVIIVG